jgi:hypothetical protein
MYKVNSISKKIYATFYLPAVTENNYTVPSHGLRVSMYCASRRNTQCCTDWLPSLFIVSFCHGYS